ncbi:hypothetical protein B0T18DRAFT_129595 [Schizothecium vesticola]|uniref:Uncharacterized protein n=1 Tax=Schizothecium vesticola TaxID=314040 RepID=A0AA40F3S1_9PEZI|nr:hypothetical protein B0T18DRAFT_129595 [Schizothecium vesticola]
MNLSWPRAASSMRFASGLESGAIIVLAPSSPRSLASRTRRPVNECHPHLVHPSPELLSFDLGRVLGTLDVLRVAGKAISKRRLAVTRPIGVVSFVQRGVVGGRGGREGRGGGGQCGIRSGHAEFVGAPKPGSGEGCVRARGGRALANSWPGRAVLFESRCPSFAHVHDLSRSWHFQTASFLSSSPCNEGQLCPFPKCIAALGWSMLSRVNLGVSQNGHFALKASLPPARGSIG